MIQLGGWDLGDLYFMSQDVEKEIKQVPEGEVKENTNGILSVQLNRIRFAARIPDELIANCLTN